MAGAPYVHWYRKYPNERFEPRKGSVISGLGVKGFIDSKGVVFS